MSWDRWEHLEGRLVCSTSRTRQLFWSCPREHNLIDCICWIVLLFSLMSVRGSCLGRNKNSVSFFPIRKIEFIRIYLPIGSGLLCSLNEGCCESTKCLSNGLHSCPITAETSMMFATHWLKAEYLVWNRSLYSIIPRERSGSSTCKNT